MSYEKTSMGDPTLYRHIVASCIQEEAEPLAVVWRVLRDTSGVWTNRAIAKQTGLSVRKVRAQTRYLWKIGMLERQETFPLSAYRVSSQAEQHNLPVYQYLNRLVAITVI